MPTANSLLQKEKRFKRCTLIMLLIPLPLHKTTVNNDDDVWNNKSNNNNDDDIKKKQ